jgi:hypothetical protein
MSHQQFDSVLVEARNKLTEILESNQQFADQKTDIHMQLLLSLGDVAELFMKETYNLMNAVSDELDEGIHDRKVHLACSKMFRVGLIYEMLMREHVEPFSTGLSKEYN